MNIRELLEDRAAKYRDKDFLIFEEQRDTYEEFNRKVNRVGNLLLNLGIKKGEPVCLMISNRPEFLYIWFGLNKIGAVMVPINTAFKTSECRYLLAHSEAAAIFVEPEFVEIIQAVRGDCPNLKNIIVLSSEKSAGVLSFPELFEVAADDLAPVAISDNDLASIVYTSGTTGLPKGVMHTHGNYALCGEAMLLRSGVGENDRMMIIMPLFHINAQFYSTMGCLTAGATLILQRRFSASQFWDQVDRYRPTQFNLIGAIGRVLVSLPPHPAEKNNSIRIANGALVTQDMFDAFTNRFGINIIDGYGLTECPLTCHNPYDGLKKIGSIGLPAAHPKMPFAEMKVVDDSGNEVPDGVVGELVVRSPVQMKGYFKDPEKTSEVMAGGWLRTGDNVYRDEDGYYFFVDRKKDIIRRRGENISSVEVENVINNHPAVEESAVIGVQSELTEDEVKAFIVLKEGCYVDPREIHAWCSERLAAFKVPRYIEYRESLLRTATEKIEKHVLRRENDNSKCFDAMKVQQILKK
jgi:crotonobetaine/carnitine-CoA ligase